LRVLEEALIAFPGVVLVVSHDRYFLNRVCTAILAFEGNGVVNYSEGNYEYYLEKKSRVKEPAVEAAVRKPNSAPTPLRDSKAAKPRKLSFSESRELEGMETAIHEAEKSIARIETLFLDPDFHRKHGTRSDEIKSELAREKERCASLYHRWEELETIRTQAAGANG
jgi:ATP-binding cassette subfamily F protein uup